MSDPNETTNDTQLQRHTAGRPNPHERDPDEGSDVGGPQAGVYSSAENELDADSSVGDSVTDDQARNPM